jgi:hypothetical protein
MLVLFVFNMYKDDEDGGSGAQQGKLIQSGGGSIVGGIGN